MRIRGFLVAVTAVVAMTLLSADVMGLIHLAQAQTNTTTDYDADDDGLIEVGSLAQLDAIRYDLDGDGSPTNSTAYDTAFPNAATGMGCPSSGCTGYELTTNLDFDTNGDGSTDVAGDAYWNDGAGWEPIGSLRTTFEGNGNAISGLMIDSDNPLGEIGLFGYVGSAGTIRNVGLSSVDVKGYQSVGGLAGENRGTISASYAEGEVEGGVPSTRGDVGGLVGLNSGTITASYASGTVSGDSEVGGLVGANSGTITAGYASGTVSGRNGVGGLVGTNSPSGTITASYASGTASGGNGVGGLAGRNEYWGGTSPGEGFTLGGTGIITASYATGTVSGRGVDVGGLVGVSYRGVGITASYWDTQTSGQSTSDGGVGKTTSELQSPTSYTGIYADWNVDLEGDGTGDDPWDFGTPSDYPFLDYVYVASGPATLPGAPTIGAVTPGTGSLTISWTAPSSDGGSPITAYDVRHIETSADESVDSNWTAVDDVWTTGGGTLQYNLTGLTGGTQYDLQVRAVNARGDGSWSATATGTPTAASDCVAGGAVTDATNTGLVSDCDTLLAARDTLAGTAELNWSADRQITAWQGVTVGGTPQRVTRLSLQFAGLTGAIPAELSKLASLTHLYLYSNQLSGSIPEELGNLVNLEEISLHTNHLTGGIPIELGSLANLRLLVIGSNQLTGKIPSELGSLSNLTTLKLSDNQLTGEIPTELGSLSNLTALTLRHNQLTGTLPQSFTNLAALEELHFHNNAGLCASTDAAFQNWLQAIPNYSGPNCSASDLTDRAILVALYNATDGDNWTNNTNWLSDEPLGNWHGVTTDANGRVTGLSLGRNALTGAIPSQLGNLSNLESLWLGDNQLTGSIPAELGTLSNLDYLGLEGNALTGAIPTELGNLSSLTWLALNGNQLTGALPQSFTNLTALDDFAFSDNAGLCAPTDVAFQTWLQGISNSNMTIEVAVPFGPNCPKLTDRDILIALYNATGGANWTDNTNWLSDEPLGDWYGVTTDADGRVTKLDLMDNRLSGRMPSQLGDLSSLRELRLANNHLSGPIPSELGKLSALTRLDLENNDLSGHIPSQLGGMPDLRVLLLGDNNLSGHVPARLGNLGKLSYLRIRSNDLTGPIPPELGRLTNLTHMYANGNDFDGSIPTELGNMSNLRYLFLNDNDLSGSIPAALGQLDKLVYLWLNHNDLTGSIPAELGDLPNLVRLYINHNNLSGAIPAKLGALGKLERLYVHRNNLSGAIPRELGGLANLKQLYAYDNDLSGAIPIELRRLAKLERLHIAENNLSGSIPSELGELTNLSRLILSLNDLTGRIPSSLGRLSNLQVLSLSNNELSGAIPAQLGDLSALIQLYMGNNYLGGCIPAKLRDVPSNDLDSLGLSDC